MHGFIGNSCPSYSESEMLANLIVDRCERDIMVETFRSINSNFVRKRVQKLLDKTVGVAVKAGWAAADQAVAQVKPKIKEAAEQSLGDVLDKQRELSDKVSAAILAILEPAVTKVSKPVMEPVLKKVCKPLYKAYKHAIKLYHAEVSSAAVSWYFFPLTWMASDGQGSR